MNKTTILLGAGAMIPYGGPTTEELTQRLLKNAMCKKEFEPIFSRTKKLVISSFYYPLLNFFLIGKLLMKNKIHKVLTHICYWNHFFHINTIQ